MTTERADLVIVGAGTIGGWSSVFAREDGEQAKLKWSANAEKSLEGHTVPVERIGVDDLDAMLERCRAAGIHLIDEQPRIGAEGKRIAFLHPKSTGGVLVELSDH